ncbi:MAG: SDR family oxidoreductase [Chitinophagaceae bacterium]|nr:SDR family oxidoreductase [Chitinophagaceae bacterium]
MKILITGANGLFGQNAVSRFTAAGYEVIAAGRGDCRLPEVHNGFRYISLDNRDEEAVHAEVVAAAPDVIVHAAAMSQPDACELNPEECFDCNVNATRYFTEAAKTVNARLIYVSTDFVFSGDDGPYREADQPAPVNYYGQTKWEGEQIVLQSDLRRAVVRTVLVYGNILSGTRSNIVTWVKENLEKGKPIKVVSDQVRTPTYVEDLVQGIQLMIEKGAEGIFHISGKEVLTPYDMAVRVADYFGLDKSLMERVDASVFSQPARRPLKTGFIIEKAERELGYRPVSFTEGIDKMFRNEGKIIG